MNRLREAHAHVAAHGREMSQLNLAVCTSTRECIDSIARESARMDAAKETGWLIANGARVESWAGGASWPSMADLDKACPRRPCMIQSFDHHACTVNAAAFTASGFTLSSLDPEGGRIVRDSRGEPTGLLLEAAYGTARRAVPELTAEQRRRAVKAGLDDLAGHGFVEVHDLLSPPWLGPILAELDAAGQLPVSVWLYPALEDVEAAVGTRERWERERVTLAGAKIFADGTLNSRTAWMLEPYADALPGLPNGQVMRTATQLAEAMVLTSSLHLGLAVHAIGDAAVRAVLDAFARHIATAGPRAGTRIGESCAWGFPLRDGGGSVPALRIEHAELIDAADVPRFAELSVVCSVQPCHLLYDIEALTRGQPGRLDRVLPLRELIAAGCRPGELLWFGSDVPIVRPHPEDSIQAAVRRGRKDGQPIGPYQALTEAEAWQAFGRE